MGDEYLRSVAWPAVRQKMRDLLPVMWLFVGLIVVGSGARLWPLVEEWAAYRLHFVDTRAVVQGTFRHYWEEHGGQMQYGLPRTDEIQERSWPDERLYTVQYFERARFARPADHDSVEAVQVTRLTAGESAAPYQTDAFVQHLRAQYGTIAGQVLPTAQSTFGGLYFHIELTQSQIKGLSVSDAAWHAWATALIGELRHHWPDQPVEGEVEWVDRQPDPPIAAPLPGGPCSPGTSPDDYNGAEGGYLTSHGVVAVQFPVPQSSSPFYNWPADGILVCGQP